MTSRLARNGPAMLHAMLPAFCYIRRVKYKVCIMAAGKGTRVTLAKSYNKAILPVGEKSALSHIIHKFPKNIEIIIAAGHNAKLMKDFVKAAYPDRKVTLVGVDPYQGPGSGPGFSLYSCHKHLQCPFIFTSADTIVLEKIPEPKENWLGVAHTNNPKDYCTVDIRNGSVKTFYIKVANKSHHAFIGMAGVKDFKAFWKGFEKKHERVEGEVQVMDGLEELIPLGLKMKSFTWFDTGNDADYKRSHKYFSKKKLLLKPDEFIFFEGDRVIKYFADEKVATDRIKRAKLLRGIAPKLVFRSKHFYAYKLVSGHLLSEEKDIKQFKKFLSFCKRKLWRKKKLSSSAKKIFLAKTNSFYLDKTMRRLQKFYADTGIRDSSGSINSQMRPKLEVLLKKVNWQKLSQGIPVLFHGDLQPENIIVKKNGFVLIDWRHSFKDIIEYGDIYYDLAKLYHALIISNEIIRNGKYNIESADLRNVHFNYQTKDNLMEFKNLFDEFLVREKYDLNKVKVLTSLIYLNIAPLYNQPYNIFLYYLGKDMLAENLNEHRRSR